MSVSKTILVLEPKTATKQVLTPEIRESVKSLFYNPGFNYLLNSLALQRAYMRTQLEEAIHSDLRAVDRLQNGIYWTNWLEKQAHLISNTELHSQPARQLRKSEMELLEEIKRNLIPVGEGTDLATMP